MPSNNNGTFSNKPKEPIKKRFVENVKWKIKNKITKNIGIPIHLLVKILSTLSEKLIFSLPFFSALTALLHSFVMN